MLLIALFDQTARAVLGLFYRLNATSATRVQKVKRTAPSIARACYKRVLRVLAPAAPSPFVKHPTLTLVLVLYYATKRLGYGFVTRTMLTLNIPVFGTLDKIKMPLSPRSLITAVTRIALLLALTYCLLIYIYLACQLVPFAKVLFA